VQDPVAGSCTFPGLPRGQARSPAKMPASQSLGCPPSSAGARSCSSQHQLPAHTRGDSSPVNGRKRARVSSDEINTLATQRALSLFIAFQVNPIARGCHFNNREKINVTEFESGPVKSQGPPGSTAVSQKRMSPFLFHPFHLPLAAAPFPAHSGNKWTCGTSGLSGRKTLM